MTGTLWTPGAAVSRKSVPTATSTPARGLTGETQAGQVKEEVKVNMPLMVRLALPRFYVQNDRATVGAIINNHTGTERRVKVTLTAEGAGLDRRADAWMRVHGRGLDPNTMEGVRFLQMHLHEGDDASCLNLNRTGRPRILGVEPAEFARRGAFAAALSEAILPKRAAAVSDAPTVVASQPVLAVPTHKIKASLRSPQMLARAAIVEANPAAAEILGSLRGAAGDDPPALAGLLTDDRDLDTLREGLLAAAAWSGYLRLPREGTFRIAEAVRGAIHENITNRTVPS